MIDAALALLADLPATALLWAMTGVMLLDAVPIVGLLIPGDVAVLAALAALGPAASAPVLVVVVGAYLVGWSASFVAGRYLGDRLRAGRLGRWIGAGRWAEAERLIRLRGAYLVVLAPFLPVLAPLIPLAAGGLHMPYRRFLAFATVGAFGWAGLYVSLGAAGAALGPASPLTLLATVVIGFAVGWVVLARIRRGLRVAAAGDR